MTKVQSDISKIKDILQSENCEAGFELLRTKNDPALNEALSDLIQSTVRSKYFEEVSDQKEVDKGLEILNDLLPNLASLDMSCCYMKKVDISKFTNLTSLDLSYCDFLENVDGIDELKNLTSLDLKNSPLLTNLDVEKIKNLPNLDFDMDVVGLRDEIGLILPKVETGYFDEWYDTLDEFLDNDFDFQKGISEDGYFGKFILLLIDESDFYDQNYNFQGPVTARWRAGRGTPDEFKDALGGWLTPKGMDYEIENAPTKDEVVILLYTLGEPMSAITSYSKQTDQFSYDCDECFETLTFAETIQVDPDDEWVRCCPDCAKERNKK